MSFYSLRGRKLKSSQAEKHAFHPLQVIEPEGFLSKCWHHHNPLLCVWTTSFTFSKAHHMLNHPFWPFSWTCESGRARITVQFCRLGADVMGARWLFKDHVGKKWWPANQGNPKKKTSWGFKETFLWLQGPHGSEGEHGRFGGVTLSCHQALQARLTSPGDRPHEAYDLRTVSTNGSDDTPSSLSQWATWRGTWKRAHDDKPSGNIFCLKVLILE